MYSSCFFEPTPGILYTILIVYHTEVRTLARPSMQVEARQKPLVG